MARPITTLQEAEQVHHDILASFPHGHRMPRRVFDRLLVVGYRKSLDASRRILETGEVAGLWERVREDVGKGQWFVLVHAVPNTLPTQSPMQLLTP